MSVDALADFIAAMEVESIRPLEPIAQRLATGELIRFRCDGDGKGRQNGWAVLYLDERPAGAFGNYRLGISRRWRVDKDLSLSPEERRRLAAEWAEAKQRRAEERTRSEAEARNDAYELWASAKPVVGHAYVERKRLDPSLFRQAGEKLLVPMLDCTGELWNLQRIGPDGTKRFLRGGRTDGLFFVFGQCSARGETVCIGEGVATMAAVHRATGHVCVAAFSAKNIAPVARVWSNARPDLDLVICADDDAHLPKNVGLDAAKAAADEVGARLALPLGRAA